jgi:hypothetical protein
MSEPDREAYEAAERLVREAHARAEEAAEAAGAASGGVPPNGWASHRAEDPASPLPDLSALLALLGTARGALPPELARQLADALRDLLLALRAIIDYSIARLERPAREQPHVEDIPIR